MSFGKINKIIKFVDKYIKRNELENLEKKDYYTTINKIINEGIDNYPEITFKLIEEILTKKYSITYKVNETIDFTGGINSFPEFKELYKEIEIPDEYKAMEAQFQKLKALPQPEQRTKAWYDYRHNRITASDTAAAIDLNPYEPVENFILKKCDPNYLFLDNDNVYHGKKFEQVATQIYEHIYNTEVVEFGALPSDKYPLLGASPDGICSSRTLDNKFSERLGTMLEIKCVVQRAIETSGNIKGTICPFYYYCQVQQQLECCELDVCDFWQCKLLEYNTREAYLLDKRNNTFHTYDNTGKKMSIPQYLKKGMILQFYPFEFKPQFEGDKIEWKSKFIYAPRLDMDEKQYDEWFIDTMNNLDTRYPAIYKECYFRKVIYWKLDQSHNQPIKRDKKFMQALLPILDESWKKVIYYRENLDKLDELRVIEKKRKIYRKMNTDFIINNDLIRNQVLFLDTPDIVPTPKDTKPKMKKFDKEEEDSLEFIDDDEPVIKKNELIIKKKVPIKDEPIIKNTTDLSSNKKVVKLKKKPKAESDKEDDGTYPKEEEQNTIKKVFIPKYVEKKTFKKTEYTEPDLDFID